MVSPAIRGRGGRRDRLGTVIALALVAAAVLFVAWPAVRRATARPEEVLVLYVREENSLGLTVLPAIGEEAASALDAEAGILRLPETSGGLPRGTRAVVLRETFVTGYLIESRAVFVKDLPGIIPGRPDQPGPATYFDCVDPASTLLGVDVRLEAASGPGGAWPALTIQALEMPEVGLGVGEEWRVAAVREGGAVCVVMPSDSDYEARIRAAFEAGQPVSVLSVRNLGLWDIDRIDLGGNSGG